MAQTLMAHSPGLARTIIMVRTGHFRHSPSRIGGTTLPLSRTNFHGPKPV